MKFPLGPIAAVLLGALVFTTSPSALRPPEKEEPALGQSQSLGDDEPHSDADLSLLRPVLRPLADFFGIAPSEGSEKTISLVPRDPNVDGPTRELKVEEKTSGSGQSQFPSPEEIRQAALKQNYSVRFQIALLADPADSYLPQSFDATVAAIRMAHAAMDFYPDRYWLPWKGSDLEKRTYRKLPGVLLFRKAPKAEKGSSGGQPAKPAEPGEVSVVLLVGETLGSGFHKMAFHQAMEVIRAWSANEPAARSKVRILGPIFSGTAEALARELRPARNAGFTFEIATGSASVREIAATLGSVATFHRTILDDDQILASAYGFLEKEMHWDFDRVALLNEGDSLYGAVDQDSPSARFIRVTMPAGLAGIRTAWEEDGTTQKSQQPIQQTKTVLDFKLGDKSQPIDLVPEFGSMTRASKDLAIANLLANLAQSGVRYIGLHFTDPRDKLFLAERVRKYAPGMILFTLDNNLLYAHPQLSPTLDGMLVFSSFPLFTESERWLRSGSNPVKRFRRQFESEVQEGTYRAELRLLGTPPASVPSLQSAAWVAVVGNGTLWPLAKLGSEGQAEPIARFESPSESSHFKLIYLFLFLVSLAVGLRKLAAPWRTVLDWSEGRGAQVLFLLLAGIVSAGLAGAVVITGTLPYLNTAGQTLAMALLANGLCQLVLKRQGIGSTQAQDWRPLYISLLALAVLSLLALPLLLRWLWMPGGAELFYLRGRRFSSGLTPLLPLLFLAFGALSWLFLEGRRLANFWRHRTQWPLLGRRSLYLADSQRLAERLLLLQKFVIPRRAEGTPSRPTPPPSQGGRDSFETEVDNSGKTSLAPTALLVAAASGPLLLLLFLIQPIAERRSFGVLFVFAVGLAGCLALFSFSRFVATWRLLQRFLDELSRDSKIMASLKRVAKEVRWQPMMAFGLELPTNDLLILSARKFDRLKAMVGDPESRAQTNPLIQQYFEAHAGKKLAREIEARESLQKLFSNALEGPHPLPESQELWDFLAIRIVVFVRHLFHHMSLSLFAALVTALSLVLAIETYAFEPKQFLSTYAWSLILGAVVITLISFVSMDRNAALSAIGNTPAGRITFDWHLLTNLLTYGVIPLLGLLATQYPTATRHLVSWFNPVLKILGTN